MGYERDPRGSGYGRRDAQDDGRDYGSGRDDIYSGARSYAAAGSYDRDRVQRDRYAQSGGQNRPDRGYGNEYHGSYASDGRRFEDVANRRDWDDDNRLRDTRGRDRDRGYRGAPTGYDYQDRGFFSRAGDEVRSWFGDDDAERRREADIRYDESDYGRRGSHDRDSDYGSWRSGQIAALDRDYEEYRRENRSKFENEFSTWRAGRQGQRDLLRQVTEHMDVVGSDGAHVGTVDKVRGDRILLTKNDADAGGRHHSITSSWLATVDTKVTLSKTADQAKAHWRDEEEKSAMFGDRDEHRGTEGDARGRMLNRSFSGTY